MKRKKTLLLMLGVLAGLCVAIAAVLGLEKHIDSINAVNEEIISLAPDSLTRVSWTRDGSTLSFIKEDGVWRDEQDEAFPVDQDAMQELLARFETVSPSPSESVMVHCGSSKPYWL